MSAPTVAFDGVRAAPAYDPASVARRTPHVATFVELVGLPGAGKTTVAREAAKQLRAAGLAVAEDDLASLTGVARLARYARFAGFCVRNPRLFRATARYTVAAGRLSVQRLRFAVGVLTHAFGASEAGRTSDVVLVSQGALQAAWSVAVGGEPPNDSRIADLVAALWPIHRGAVVHVDIDPVRASARIARRTGGESRFDRMPAVAVDAELRPMAEHLAKMTRAVFGRVGDAGLRLDGGASPIENAAVLAAFIQRGSRLGEAQAPRVPREPPAVKRPARRIALFVPNLEVGGAERVIVNLAGGFVRRGFAVDLLLIRREGFYLPQVSPNVRIITLAGRRALYIVPALVRYLRRERPEAMLATLTYANIAAVIARRIAGVATRVTVREANALTREAAGAKALKDRQLPRGARWFYPWADAIVAVSAGAADSLVEATGMARDRVHVLDNPVVTDDLAGLAAEPVDHPWLTTDNSQPVIVAAGRLTAQKDFATLLRAFAIVRTRRTARLLILGDGELRESLEGLVRDLGIEADVSMPGVMQNPFAYMSRATLFVLSSAWEGSPGVLIQAMASGAPVIATDCESGPREILRGGEYGPLVTVGDVAGLATAMETMLALPRRSPPASSWRRFSVETSVDAYLKVLGIC